MKILELARNLIINYPITKFMSHDLISNACIKENSIINVIYIGFSLKEQAIHYDSVRNNQLVTTKNNEVVPYLINYYAYDNNDIQDEYYASFVDNYNNINNYEYFEAPDYPCYFKKINYIDINQIIEIIEKSNYTVVYIADEYKDYINNVINIASNNYHIFIDDFDHPRVTSYKNINQAFSFDNIKKTIQNTYNSIYKNQPTINELSSLYSGLNLRLKLNLLGYDFEYEEDNNDELVNELYTKLNSFEHYSYDDYLFTTTFNEAQALAYQEHLRWNAFYIYNGYKPYKKTEIYYDRLKNKIIKDNHDLKLHACLTTTWGLDEYHKLCAKLKFENENITYEEALDACNSYKYDYMIIEKIKKIFSENKIKLNKIFKK